MVSLRPKTQSAVHHGWFSKYENNLQPIRASCIIGKAQVQHFPLRLTSCVCEAMQWRQAVGEGQSNSMQWSCSPADYWERDAAEYLNVFFCLGKLDRKAMTFALRFGILNCLRSTAAKEKFSSCFILSKHIHTCCLDTSGLINVLWILN